MKRIFLVTYHKVLLSTQLKEYKSLGYDVVYPFNHDLIYDQSASVQRKEDWLESNSQSSSLKKDILCEIGSYNFLIERQFSKKIINLLEKYFDVVIVCQNPVWLYSFLKDFKKVLSFKMYGNTFTFSKKKKNIIH